MARAPGRGHAPHGQLAAGREQHEAWDKDGIPQDLVKVKVYMTGNSVGGKERVGSHA